MRRTIQRWKSNIDMLPALVLGSFVVSLCLFSSCKDMRLAFSDLPPLLLNGALLVPLSQALLFEGSRYLHSAESSMIMCIETALSPIMASAVLGEHLHPCTLLGGATVILTLLVHAAWPLRELSTGVKA
eukprot:TRINITY_DN66886_c0_g1_i1.p1 TRINITY_DN66886_c0_g1~~TRINITY_DN66886_c0_g1_i1.p1  ORF type:complete len:151 (-),score=23.17 TRINITY_DN66886_c0_g1_i1:2-388(-)